MLIFFGLFLSFLCAIFFLRYLRKYAIKIDFVDRPNDALKSHEKALPYLGGAGIFAASWISILCISFFENIINFQLVALFLLNFILLVVGTLDDKFHISWRIRLFIQLIVSTGTVYYLGLNASENFFSFFFYVILLVGIINSINLIDISDGLSTTISISAIIFLLFINIIMNNNIYLLLLMVCFFGALSYFLFLNFPPAKMYMGDGGSNCLGHILGVFAFISFNHLNWVTGTLSTVLVLIVPLFDTLFVMALRLSKRKNPFEGSPDHFAVRMRLNGYSSFFILICALTFSAIGGFLAILILVKSSPIFSAILSTIIFSSLLLVAFILFKAFPINSDRNVFLRGGEYDS